MNCYIEIENGENKLKLHESQNYLMYDVYEDKIVLDEQNKLDRQKKIVGYYNNNAFKFFVQPLNNIYLNSIAINNGSITGQNILNNISGLIDKEKETSNIRNIQMQIGQELDNKLFNTNVSDFTTSGSFTITDSNLSNFLTNYSDRVYFQFDNKFVNGFIEIRQGYTQFVPVSIIDKDVYDFQSIYKLNGIKGRIDIEEDIYLEAVFDKDNNNTLYANFFGTKTGITYKLVLLDNGINAFHGMYFNNKYIYQLVEKDNNAQHINFVNDTTSNLHLIKFDLIENVLYSYPVQYKPIKIDGIKVIGNLLLIKDFHGIIINEFIDANYTLENDTITLNHPFTHYSIMNYSMSGETLTNTIDDQPDIDLYNVRIFGQYNNNFISPASSIVSQYLSYSYLEQNSISNYFTFDNYEIYPTYIDSIQYLYSIEREDFELLGEVFGRIYHENIGRTEYMKEYLYLYPIPFNIQTLDNTNVDISFIDVLNVLPDTFLVLTLDNITTIFEEITNYNDLNIQTEADLITSIKNITNLSNDIELKRQHTELSDKYLEAELKLTDNLKPIAVKYYVPKLKFTNESFIKCDNTDENQLTNGQLDITKSPVVNIIQEYSLVNPQYNIPLNDISTATSIVETVNKITKRYVSVGKIVGIVTMLDSTTLKIEYLIN